jgi:hypothetical protein
MAKTRVGSIRNHLRMAKTRVGSFRNHLRMAKTRVGGIRNRLRMAKTRVGSFRNRLRGFYRGHPLGRGSNRKSVSVPILFFYRYPPIISKDNFKEIC